VSNDGMHDFGYPCSMPGEVTIDGLFVDDTNHPGDYQGLYLFTDPDAVRDAVEDITPTAERPFPYGLCRKVKVRGLTTASGKKPRLSPNEKIGSSTVVIEEG
jgi:hypothetical protein